MTFRPAAAQGTGNFLDLTKIIPSNQTPTDASSVPDQNSSQQSPTDQAPVEYPEPSPLTIGKGLAVGGAVDLRGESIDSGRQDGFLNGTEIDGDQRIVTDGKTNGKIVLQLIGERSEANHSKTNFQFGDAYVIYKLPIESDTKSTAYLTAGQFQIPFGLLAVYDPHQLLQQPLYSESLGIRNDWGAKVSGRFYGLLNYDFSVTSGAGPNHSIVGSAGVVCFRLGRTFITRNGIFNVGGSLLQGHLPNTDLNLENQVSEDLPPSGYVTFQHQDPVVNKTRIAGDGTYLFRNIVARGEAILGADDSQRVEGYYLECNYHVSSRVGGIVARTLWKYPVGNSYTLLDSVGMSYSPQKNLIFRALYSVHRDVPVDSIGSTRHILTVQALLRF